MTGCNLAEPTPKCYYPEFPQANPIVKQSLKGLNNKEVDEWVNQLVVYKEKVEILKGGKDGQR